MDALKVRVRFGELELEYEGPEGFLKDQVPRLLTEIAKSAPLGSRGGPPVNSAASPSTAQASSGAIISDFTTNTIASLMDAKTGPDLAIAAAAHLTLTRGQDKFSRKEMLDQMQTATTFYNQNYSGNLSKILNGLTKGKKLNLVGNQTYALTRAERERVSTILSSAAQ
jgi:hypothetical protein